MRDVLMETNVPGFKCHRGKVRGNYDIGNNTMVIVATDRLSAFDEIMKRGIPDKGRVLNGLSKFWFTRPGQPVLNHHISTNLDDMPEAFQKPEFEGRTMLVRKARKVFPVECVVRGYIMGSGWKSYQKDGTICGIKLRPGLRLGDKLDEDIFTPTTKAETSHDEPITLDQMANTVGKENTDALRYASLQIYKRAHDYALQRNIIIADTKFEFGLWCDVIMLIDEVLTPDSSRFWPKQLWTPGKNPPSLDKQPVRDWLESTGWDKQPPAPDLPDWLIESTHQKYLQIYETLTGQALAA